MDKENAEAEMKRKEEAVQVPTSRDKEGCTPNGVPMVFIGVHLGILGDYKP